MFHADITFVLALIAIVAGALLVLFARVHKELSTGPCTLIGYVVIILSIIVLLISGYGIGKALVVRQQIIRMMQQGKMMPMKQYMMQRRMPMQGQMPMQPGMQQSMMQDMQPKADTSS